MCSTAVAGSTNSTVRETALVKDVTSLDLALEQTEAILLEQMRAAGWSVGGDEPRADQGVLLRVAPRQTVARDHQVMFLPAAEAEPRTETLGLAVLRVEADRASLRFAAAR
jgi:hypothetical protein